MLRRKRKKRMPDGHTLTNLHIHNSYGSTNCFRFEGIISAIPISGKAPLCFKHYLWAKIQKDFINDSKIPIKVSK